MKKIAFCLVFLLVAFVAHAATTITFTDTGRSVKITDTDFFDFNIEVPYNSVYIQPIPAQGGNAAHLVLTRIDGSHLMDVFHADVTAPSTANIAALHVALSAMFYKPVGIDTVSGTVGVNNFPNPQAISASTLPLPSGASTASAQASILAELEQKTEPGQTQTVTGTVAVSNFPATQPVSFSTPVDVDGTLSIDNFPATQPISGSVSVSNLPATQAVSGAVSVSNFPATQPVSGSVSVSNFPASQTVSGAVSITGTPAVTISGTPSVSTALTFATQTITQLTAAGTQSASFDVSGAKTGTFVYKCASLPALGVVSLSMQGSNNGTDWATIQGATNISIANANLSGVFAWSTPYQFVRISFDGETLGTTTVIDAVGRACN